MKKINFKNPRYVLPLICLPFIFLLFFVYRSFAEKNKSSPQLNHDITQELSPVSQSVREKALDDKLQAFKERYKKGDGYTALATIDSESSTEEGMPSSYNAKEKQMIDSISAEMKSRANAANRYAPGIGFTPPERNFYDRRVNGLERKNELREILSDYSSTPQKPVSKPSDPMAVFRAQMAIVDSMNKAAISASIPDAGKSNRKTKTQLKPDTLAALPVKKSLGVTLDPSTILSKTEDSGFLQAMIEESMTGYSGSRVSIRLLNELMVGNLILKKGTLIYALITGFGAQRVHLSVSSILYQGKILPVKLEVFDLDGMKGLYIPSSLYREFSRDLASSSVSGVTFDSPGDQNQQLMSLMGRMFQSTTGAISKIVRSNKVKIRYPSMIYLLDASNQKSNP